jgi:DNA-binding MarR family transcriptional regulator
MLFEAKVKEDIAENKEYFDLYELILRASHVMQQARKKELATFDVSPGQSFIIRTIHGYGDKATLSEISKAVYRKINSTSEQISRTEANGFLEKTRNGQNIKYKLTKKGLTTFDNMKKQESINLILSALSKDERKMLGSLITKLLSRINKE